MSLEQEKEKNFKWYVVKVKSNSEKKAKSEIETKIHKHGETLVSCLSETMIPTTEEVEMKNDKKIITYKNQLPGYIFVKMVLNNQMEAFLTSLAPIAGVLKSPVSQSKIDKFLGVIADKNQEDEKKSQYVGKRIKIIAGKYKSLEGVVEKFNENENSFVVNVKLLQKSNLLEIDHSDLKFLEE